MTCIYISSEQLVPRQLVSSKPYNLLFIVANKGNLSTPRESLLQPAKLSENSRGNYYIANPEMSGFSVHWVRLSRLSHSLSARDYTRSARLNFDKFNARKPRIKAVYARNLTEQTRASDKVRDGYLESATGT